jgi:hypothetical protein
MLLERRLLVGFFDCDPKVRLDPRPMLIPLSDLRAVSNERMNVRELRNEDESPTV